MTQEWFLTAPWEPIAIRRGDPLGFRVTSNAFAEILAPGLSNRTQDARWLSILSWCLCISDHAPWRDGLEEASPRTRLGMQRRYQWLRPLELLWVARTHQLLGNDATRERQLPGIRAVRRWTESKSERFGMSDDQWQRYRQTGIYGAYRVAFRSLPGLSVQGDGWTPGVNAMPLAECVASSLVGKYPNLDRDRAFQGTPDRCWFVQWKDWAEPGLREMSPESVAAISALKDRRERHLLAELIFGAGPGGVRRRQVAEAAQKSDAKNHATLCGDIATSMRMVSGCECLALLQPFTEFADAALNVMQAIWNRFRDPDLAQPRCEVNDLAVALDHEFGLLETLMQTAERWVSARNNHAGLLLSSQCDELASGILQVRENDVEIIRRLVAHHGFHGGGLRWMRIQDGFVVPLVRLTDVTATPYRFRLWQLCRMAVQCGVIDELPAGLVSADDAERGDGDE